MDAFQTMVKYYNTCENKDTNYQIIEYILKHIDTINNMAITQIAEETYVSKPTITRFIRKFTIKIMMILKNQFIIHIIKILIRHLD